MGPLAHNTIRLRLCLLLYMEGSEVDRKGGLRDSGVSLHCAAYHAHPRLDARWRHERYQILLHSEMGRPTQTGRVGQRGHSEFQFDRRRFRWPDLHVVL